MSFPRACGLPTYLAQATSPGSEGELETERKRTVRSTGFKRCFRGFDLVRPASGAGVSEGRILSGFNLEAELQQKLAEETSPLAESKAGGCTSAHACHKNSFDDLPRNQAAEAEDSV